jgi:hypothetical protein
MREILPQLREWFDNATPFATATVVETRGSAPRQPGAVMTVAADPFDHANPASSFHAAARPGRWMKLSASGCISASMHIDTAEFSATIGVYCRTRSTKQAGTDPPSGRRDYRLHSLLIHCACRASPRRTPRVHADG